VARFWLELVQLPAVYSTRTLLFTLVLLLSRNNRASGAIETDAGELPAADDIVEQGLAEVALGIAEEKFAAADGELVRVCESEPVGLIEGAEAIDGGHGVDALGLLEAYAAPADATGVGFGTADVVGRSAESVVEQHGQTLGEAALEADVQGIVVRAAMLVPRTLTVP